MASDVTLSDDAVYVHGNLVALGDIHGSCLAAEKVTVDSELAAQFIRIGALELSPLVVRNLCKVIGWLVSDGTYFLELAARDVVVRDPAAPENKPKGVALSHMPDSDRLVVNRGGVYGGGVSVEGNVRFQGDIDASGNSKLHGVAVQGTAEFSGPVAMRKGLTIGNITIGVYGAASIPQPVSTLTSHKLAITERTILATTSHVVLPGQQAKTEVLDLVAEIRSLRDRVAALEKKLASL